MRRFLILSSLVLSFTGARHAMAHPGHGNEQLANTPAHYLLDPFHAIWTIAMVAMLFYLSRPGRRLVAARVRSWNERSRERFGERD